MLSDYPNHLARMHILLNAGKSADLNRFYEINWAAIPNLAMDLIVPVLSLIVGIEFAGKLFLGLILLLISSGTILLHYALHRRPSLWPFIVFLLLYNTIFLYGLVNFFFGIGASLWVISAWLFVRDTPRWWHLVAFPLAALGIFFCHLAAFGFFVLVITAYEFSRFMRGRTEYRNWISLGALITGIVATTFIFLKFSPSTGWPLSWLGNYLENMLQKILLILTLFWNYNIYLDTFTIFIVSVFLTKWVRSHTLVIAGEMLLPMIGIGLAILFMPRVLFGSSLADSRLFVALAFIFVSSVDIKLLVLMRVRVLTACILVIILLVRTNVILNHWDEADTVTMNAAKALSKMENGKRLLVVFDEHKGEKSFLENFEKFLPCLAIISRSAFVPSLYALPGAQPVLLTPPFQLLKATMPKTLIPDQGADWTRALHDYDYVWIAEDTKFAHSNPTKMSLIVNDARFQFYRVNKK